MRVRRSVFAVVTVVATATALTVMSGPAAPRTALRTLSASITPVADVWAPLQEFRTSGNGGWFYTLNPGEAVAAVRKYHFSKSATIGSLHPSAVPGGVALHRLRLKNGGPSYLLSISPNEVRGAQFVDEGVVGYADGGQGPGEVKLMRFSNHGQWRALADGPANVSNMKAMGYAEDGPLGWYRP